MKSLAAKATGGAKCRNFGRCQEIDDLLNTFSLAASAPSFQTYPQANEKNVRMAEQDEILLIPDTIFMRQSVFNDLIAPLYSVQL